MVIIFKSFNNEHFKKKIYVPAKFIKIRSALVSLQQE